MDEPTHFGAWLLTQDFQGSSAVARGIRKLVAAIKDDPTWPKLAISFSTYQRFLLKNYRHSPDLPAYTLALQAGWDVFEKYLEQQNRP